MKDTSYQIALSLKYNSCQRGLASMVFKFFDKKTGSGASLNEELVQELQKPVIKKLKKTVHVGFKNNIRAADLAKMGSLSSKN